MSHYKPYPTYKDSGAEWIGEVPEHWDSVKIARLGPLTKANGGSKQDNVDSGIPCIRYGDLYTTHEFVIRGSRSYISADKLGDYTPIQYGDALFSASGETLEDIGKSAVNLLQEEACCGGDVIVLRPATNLDPMFLGYALDSMLSKAQKAQMGKGYTVVHIYGDQLRDLIVALPPLSEQQAIGAAIDRETSHIDALVAKKKHFIELLQEKRQALITHAVTKGLDPNVKMKDSGVEWLGEVPEHWELRKVAWDMKITIGWTPPTGNRNYYGGPYNWVSIADLSAGAVYNTKQTITDAAIKVMHGSQAPVGSLLFSYKLSIGEVALLEQPAYTNEAIAAFHPCKRVHMSFWKYAAPVILPRYSRENIYGSALLNQELMNSARMFLPELVEQEVIAAAIDRETARINELVAKIKRSIDLLMERRAAFIAVAVTGKIDVRSIGSC